MIALFGSNGKSDQRWGNTDVIKGSRHRVLTADCRRFKCHLRFNQSQHRLSHIAPFIGIITQSFKVFLIT